MAFLFEKRSVTGNVEKDGQGVSPGWKNTAIHSRQTVPKAPVCKFLTKGVKTNTPPASVPTGCSVYMIAIKNQA